MNAATPSTCRRRLVDDTVLAYVEWREECVAVADMYRRWASATDRRRLAHAAYEAALDREESAAHAYEQLVQRARDQFAESPEPFAGSPDPLPDVSDTGWDHPLPPRGVA